MEKSLDTVEISEKNSIWKQYEGLTLKDQFALSIVQKHNEIVLAETIRKVIEEAPCESQTQNVNETMDADNTAQIIPQYKRPASPD